MNLEQNNKTNTKSPIQCYWPWGNTPSSSEPETKTTSGEAQSWTSYFSDKLSTASSKFWDKANTVYNESTKFLTEHAVGFLATKGIHIKESELPKLVKYLTYFTLGAVEADSDKLKLDLELKDLTYKKKGQSIVVKNIVLKDFSLVTLNFASDVTSNIKIGGLSADLNMVSENGEERPTQASGQLLIENFECSLHKGNLFEIIGNSVLAGLDQTLQTEKMDKENPEKSFKEALVEKIKYDLKYELKSQMNIESKRFELAINYLTTPKVTIIPFEAKDSDTVLVDENLEETDEHEDITAKFKIENTNISLTSNGLDEVKLENKGIDISLENIIYVKDDDEYNVLDYISYLNEFHLKLDDFGNGFFQAGVILKPETINQIITENKNSFVELLRDSDEVIANILDPHNVNNLIQAVLSNAKKSEILDVKLPIENNVLSFGDCQVSFHKHPILSSILQKILRKQVRVIDTKSLGILSGSKKIPPEMKIKRLGKEALQVTLETLGVPLSKHQEKNVLIPKDSRNKKDMGGINLKHFTEIALEGIATSGKLNDVEKKNDGFDMIDFNQTTPTSETSETDFEQLSPIIHDNEDPLAEAHNDDFQVINSHEISDSTARTSRQNTSNPQELGFEVVDSNDLANQIASNTSFSRPDLDFEMVDTDEIANQIANQTARDTDLMTARRRSVGSKLRRKFGRFFSA